MSYGLFINKDFEFIFNFKAHILFNELIYLL